MATEYEFKLEGMLRQERAENARLKDALECAKRNTVAHHLPAPLCPDCGAKLYVVTASDATGFVCWDNMPRCTWRMTWKPGERFTLPPAS
jgi:hypothetical protein